MTRLSLCALFTHLACKKFRALGRVVSATLMDTVYWTITKLFKLFNEIAISVGRICLSNEFHRCSRSRYRVTLTDSVVRTEFGLTFWLLDLRISNIARYPSAGDDIRSILWANLLRRRFLWWTAELFWIHSVRCQCGINTVFKLFGGKLSEREFHEFYEHSGRWSRVLCLTDHAGRWSLFMFEIVH